MAPPISRRARWLALMLVALTVLAVAAAAGFRWAVYQRPLAIPGERIELLVEPGASTRAIARTLGDAGVPVNALLFEAAARWTESTQRLRAGRYEVLRGTTLAGLLEKLRRGEVLPEHITLVEGWTLPQLRAALAAAPALRQDTAALSEAELLARVGVDATQGEGWFAPDTYRFDPGSSDLDVLRQAHREQTQRLARAWAGRASGLPYQTPYHALIMASIIEKETGRDDERGRVAAVFVNRLRIGMPLQTDPTVIYGLGAKFDGNLRRRDLETDGPYNTYLRGGLPPTPIAAPSRASIEAALHPDDSRALYFVARGDGTSQFSETLAEHNRAVDRYQRRGGRR